jgi:hypothetical protein
LDAASILHGHHHNLLFGGSDVKLAKISKLYSSQKLLSTDLLKFTKGIKKGNGLPAASGIIGNTYLPAIASVKSTEVAGNEEKGNDDEVIIGVGGGEANDT